MAGGGIKISNIKVNGGADGATFIPSVSSDGVLSWTNNKGYTNPTSVNIKGKDGKDGKDGVNGANIVSTILQGQDANGGNIYKQTFSNGATANFTAPRGAMGKTGAKGDKGDSGNPQGNILQTTGTSAEDTMSQNAVTEALKIWSQRTEGEEDLNALADAGYQKAYISRYGTDTTNKPTTYGNIISFRSSAGDLTQLALAVTTNKIFYRQAGTFSQYGTWQEVLVGLLEKGDNFSLSLSNGFRLQVITDTSGVSVAAGQVTNKKYTYPIAYSSVGQVVGITTNESGITTSINSDNSAVSKDIYFRNNTTNNITIRRVNIFIIGY